MPWKTQSSHSFKWGQSIDAMGMPKQTKKKWLLCDNFPELLNSVSVETTKVAVGLLRAVILVWSLLPQIFCLRNITCWLISLTLIQIQMDFVTKRKTLSLSHIATFKQLLHMRLSRFLPGSPEGDRWGHVCGFTIFILSGLFLGCITALITNTQAEKVPIKRPKHFTTLYNTTQHNSSMKAQQSHSTTVCVMLHLGDHQRRTGQCGSPAMGWRA